MLTPVYELCVGAADGELIQRADIIITYSGDLEVSLCADIDQHGKLWKIQGKINTV